MVTFSLDDVRAVRKKRDAWWTVFLVDPVAIRLTRFLANRTSITPNQITVGSIVLGALSAASFALASPGWLALGALFYHLSFVLDCCDGKIARLKRSGTLFGLWLDFMFDQARVVCCALTLTVGQYAVTGQVAYLYLGFAIICLDVLRYLNSSQVSKARRLMRKRIKAAVREQEALELAAGIVAPQPRLSDEQLTYVEDTLRQRPDPDLDEVAPSEERVVDLHRGFNSRFPWYRGVRVFMLRHRVRTHLISGIEFQMAAFIIAPLLAAVAGSGAIFAVTIGAGAPLLILELVIIYKLLLQTRDCQRVLDELASSRNAASERRSLTVVGGR
ncbi:CDP-alcohol phosphatidyltransferase family protein [Actinomadura sp. HBU206391]|uniref:CDP-alcohol phosphatidyltransferase family protein n=1 Tax=Actinomadura sp. HBU206391 TaxID=2731692 RepID=UPI001650B849|nr:CDP-alcohol phosphatidyltransferase family protein [Actinomadura sp. HBU206391]MBC6456962.1 CDP-alcohol phosphatidyltransferase family protein [Actinomadura sp. HBU206391]